MIKHKKKIRKKEALGLGMLKVFLKIMSDLPTWEKKDLNLRLKDS